MKCHRPWQLQNTIKSSSYRKMSTAAPGNVNHGSFKVPSDPAPTKNVDRGSNEVPFKVSSDPAPTKNVGCGSTEFQFAMAALKYHQIQLLQKMLTAAAMKCHWPWQLQNVIKCSPYRKYRLRLQ